MQRAKRKLQRKRNKVCISAFILERRSHKTTTATATATATEVRARQHTARHGQREVARGVVPVHHHSVPASRHRTGEQSKQRWRATGLPHTRRHTTRSGQKASGVCPATKRALQSGALRNCRSTTNAAGGKNKPPSKTAHKECEDRRERGERRRITRRSRRGQKRSRYDNAAQQGKQKKQVRQNKRR